MKYTVAYIDEVDSDIRSFKRSVLLRSTEKFDVISYKPRPSINETISEIFENHIDAIVADFRLSEEDPLVHYNGSDVIREILNIRIDFPVFILTSFEDDAIDKGFDVNIVYEKKDIQESSKFFEKVIIQIKKHKAKIELAEVRLIELLKKQNEGEITYLEEEELITLDSFIEKTLDRKSSIPNNFKCNSNSERLNKLIDKTDELINEIKLKKKNE
jgi:hypothetical protein